MRNGSTAMNDGRTSPKRRHILSSINPEDASHPPPPRHRRAERRSRSASPSSPPRQRDNPVAADGTADHDASDGDATRPRRSRLKLKGDKSSRSRRHHHGSRRRHRSRDRPDEASKSGDQGGDDNDVNGDDKKEGEESSRRHRHHRHHRRRRHRTRSPTPPNPHEPEPLDPEAAFRESLFDAMADEEGAAYWEGVYGQPVHIYEQDKVGPQGELERMTEEEYAAHVRQKMWEKTHAGLLEERAQRAERRKQKEAEARHSKKLHEEMERSLKRGEERREKKRWQSRWEDYTTSWENWDGSAKSMAWPWKDGVARRPAGWGIVEDGEEEEIDEKEVRSFFVMGLAAEEIGEAAFVSKLKDERVRWHPDKIQQRLGGKVDEKVMRDVTAIFQIIDRLWADMRKKE